MIHLLWGEDHFSLYAKEKAIVANLVPLEWRSVSLNFLEGTASFVSEVVDAARTPSFFGNRVVVVRNCSWFSPSARVGKAPETTDSSESGDPVAQGNDSQGQQELLSLISCGLPPGSHLLFCVPRKIHQGLKTTRALLEAKSTGKALVHEFPAPDPFHPEQTIAWLCDHAHREGLRIERRAAEAIVERLGQEKYLLDAEVHKLAAYASGKAISTADVALLTSGVEGDVFELLEAITQRRTSEAIKHLRHLIRQNHSLKILTTMATMVRTWWLIKVMADSLLSAEDIGRAVSWHPFRVKRTLESLRSWSSIEVRVALQQVQATELALKGDGFPPPLELERLLVVLASRSKA